GVVNVITRRGGRSGLDAMVGFGRYGLQQFTASGRWVGDAAEVSLSANSTEADGFPTRRGDSTDRGYRNRSFALSARTEAGPVELGARVWRAAGNTEYSDFFLTPVDQDFTNSAAAVEAGWRANEAFRSRVTVSRILDDVEQSQSPDFVQTRRDSVDWQNELELGHHSLTFGALLTREDTRTLSFGSGFDTATDSNTFYAQNQVRLGAHRLLLATGYTDHETFGGHATWNVEYGHALGRDTTLTAAVGTAFRAPDATDRFGFGGNPALDPERSRNVELGLRHRLAPGHVLGVSAFDNHIDDLIQFVTVSFTPFSGENRNVDRARIRGVEATWQYDSPSFSARATAIRQQPEDRNTGARLLRRAEQSYTFALARRVGRHEFGADALVSGDREDFGFPRPVRLGGYSLVNLHARIALTPAWTVQARLENALDRRYELASGFNTMRRAVMVATRYGFR
ncbi:MAG: TonB-dependent receptor plug domain-containing protein, partial [Pseudomonadota bacterium]